MIFEEEFYKSPPDELKKRVHITDGKGKEVGEYVRTATYSEVEFFLLSKIDQIREEIGKQLLKAKGEARLFDEEAAGKWVAFEYSIAILNKHFPIIPKE